MYPLIKKGVLFLAHCSVATPDSNSQGTSVNY